MKVLSIQLWHSANVAYLEDGQIKCILQEEKFDNVKNSNNFPRKTLKYLAERFDLSDVDKVVFPSYGVPESLLIYQDVNQIKKTFVTAGRKITLYDRAMYVLLKVAPFLMKHFDTLMIKYWQRFHHPKILPLLQEVVSPSITADKIVFVEHHEAHALSPIYFFGLHKRPEPVLIFTLDGRGDTCCAAVKIRSNWKLTNVAETPNNYSIWFLWSLLTMAMGMKPLEHEYKIMWLAAYAEEKYFMDVYNTVFKNLVKIDWLKWKARIPLNRAHLYLKNMFYGRRFDNIAGALQYATEKLVLQWIENAVQKTWITTIATSWGVFMNVKLNKRVQELDCVKKVYFMPSCGDESNVVGGILWTYLQTGTSIEDLAPINTMYSGINYTRDEYKKFVDGLDKNTYEVQDLGDDEQTGKKIAKLLSEFIIVGVVRWAWEWGARSLCNRAILANASDLMSFHKVNDMIKMRDFWMPFAPVMLEEYAGKYIANRDKIWSKSIESHRYMISAVDSTPLAQHDLIASIHQKDKTLRPQLVNKESNPRMYAMMKEYEGLTGYGGMMNTSLNIHGYPMVGTLDQAMFTLNNSWMTHILLGNYLVIKKK